MKRSIFFLLILLSFASPAFAATWPLDGVDDSLIVRGKATTAAGAAGKCLVLDGESLIELKGSAKLASGEFTVSRWFNPYDLAGGQQMLAGKNRYSLDERQWGLTIEPDGKLKAHLRQSGWSTIACNEPLVAGRWHLATLAADARKASLYLNGKLVGEVKLASPIAATEAPITLGGIWDAGAVRQAFRGAVDEFSFQPRVLSEKEIAASYQPVSATHDVPKVAAGLPLWDATQTLPKAADLPQVKGAKFYVLKKPRPDEDGSNFTLGVGLAWHKDKLYASYGFSTSEQENTADEEAHVRVSEDGGKTWGQPVAMDAGEGNLGVSHGVFLSHGGRLWAFMGAFYDNFYGPTSRTHTRGYVLNETSGKWEAQGVVLDQGFWPMQEPQQMADGSWIMSGVRIAFGLGVVGHLPAVAISRGDDFTKWEMVVIQADKSLGTNLWGESTVIVEKTQIINIARRSTGRVRGHALVSISKDHGRTWTPAAASNLPMATQKPYAGTLSTGQRYLIGTITADTDGRRSPLTIAVSKPDESLFSRVFLIRTSVFDGTPGVSAQDADFSYPYAVERNGQLYIGYTDKEHIYNELAVIPVSSLEIKP
ncbi:MAG: LamG-like jellyroll fold domain-containing protein [Prosthecobacter sp.]|uniref:LamG-like jellyroll fold domain-containing protein n=1 Tax=Prosthecobacter sp. TaxID=1965333 RepID=UPI0039044F6F